MRLLALVTLATMALAGCNPRDAADLKEDTQRLAGTATRAASNATVAAKVNTALSLRKGIDMSGLHIENEGGTVTVGGHVRTAQERRLVLDTVEGTRGVDRVVDELRVESDRPADKPSGRR